MRVRWTRHLENGRGNGFQSPGSKWLLGVQCPHLLFSVALWAVVKPEVLQKATVELLDQSLCSSLYGHSLTDRMVCAGYLDGKVDSCQVGCQGKSVTFCPLPLENKQVHARWNQPALGRWKQEAQEFKV